MLRLFNTLTREIESFKPIKAGLVKIYVCGPTVYNYIHLGNFRAYIFTDLLRRYLEYRDFKVKQVMNITDVDDKTIKESQKKKKTLKEFTDFYLQVFIKDLNDLNIKLPEVMPRATEHIKEMVELIKALIKKGFAYKTGDGSVYFKIAKFPRYGELAQIDKQSLKPNIEGRLNAEDEYNKEELNDFVLWKAWKPSDGKVFWQTDLGKGRPGWHIECSAMSMKYLGESFDIHIGGEDLRQTHHPNEIAQSEGATGKKFVNYWMHTTFLLIDGKRMGKSEGNAYTISDIEERGIDPPALRYLYLTAHYRDPLNFTWESLEAAQTAYEKLKTQMSNVKTQNERTALSAEKQEKVEQYRQRFIDSVNDDLNTPQALAVLWDMLKSNIPSEDKYDLSLYYDEVLGLGLGQHTAISEQLPAEIQRIVEEREHSG